MAAPTVEVVEDDLSEVSAKLSLLLNRLRDVDRVKRRKALEEIRSELFSDKYSSNTAKLNKVYGDLSRPLLKCFSDPVEKCRALSIQLVLDIIQTTQTPSELLPYLVPTLVERLGNNNITESAEELRLDLVNLLAIVITLCNKAFVVYMDEVVQILQKTIVDPFPDVRLKSCKCASDLSQVIPAQHFHMCSENFVPALLKTLSHQHSKVRIVAIQAIGDVINHGSSKCVEDVVPHLAQRYFDQTPQVRLAVTQVIGMWLLELPDRYSYFCKLLPLLLTSITDDVPKIQQTADELWSKVGFQYEKENDQDFKDRLDFVTQQPPHYPCDVVRPNLGCRELVYRHMSRILPALLRDLTDWVAATRVKAAALLYVLLLNAEDRMTQHLESLLRGLYSACGDEETSVVNHVMKSARLVGCFVPADAWWHLMMADLESIPTANHVMTLTAIVEGCNRSSLRPHLPAIADVLAADDVCRMQEVRFQQHLVSCIRTVLNVSKDDCSSISAQLFNAILSLLPLIENESSNKQAHEAMLELAKVQGFTDQWHLMELHMPDVLNNLHETCNGWSSISHEAKVFTTLVTESGPVIGKHLNVVISIFEITLSKEKEAELRLKLFYTLAELMVNAKYTLDSEGMFAKYASKLLNSVIVPNCSWQAGRTAAAIRTTAVSCLWVLFQSGAVTPQLYLRHADALLPQLTSLLEDDSRTTRLLASRVVKQTLNLCGDALQMDALLGIYPTLLKRMDDVSLLFSAG
ncbi:PREDICTED: dynein assembly factor 5, axonemal-like isoform X2 [Priapulus caudatus]|uniref:Dynein assembly factor 5, axonemal-like isoform X2 n=1 Tax=Priapulus caudatus TaxID=37621 RepID=A0ABM1FBR2_PRICU|nr:PREDICTED: dynein assembly factor 5, axonemal-like isoform X2 [Priapulus caudatus]